MKKIVVFCAGGMSSSMLVKKMQETIELKEYEAIVLAHSVMSVEKYASDADIVLLGPQIRHEKASVEAKLSCPVMTIDMKDYGMMDGEAVIEKVMMILND